MISTPHFKEALQSTKVHIPNRNITAVRNNSSMWIRIIIFFIIVISLTYFHWTDLHLLIISSRTGVPNPWSIEQHRSVRSMPENNLHKQVKLHPQDAGSPQKHSPTSSLKNHSPQNWSLVPKRLGATALEYMHWVGKGINNIKMEQMIWRMNVWCTLKSSGAWLSWSSLQFWYHWSCPHKCHCVPIVVSK